MSNRPRASLLAGVKLFLSEVFSGANIQWRPKYYIVSTRRERSHQKLNPPYKKHTSRHKAAKRARCKARRRRA